MIALRTGPAIALGLALAVMLSGCNSTKRALGLEKSSPDEFAVMNRGPLVMPPDFSLRPPVPGAGRPQELPAAEQARVALMGRAKLDNMRARGFSPGEVALLARAGAGDAPPDIRTQLDREASTFSPEDKQMTDKLLTWKDETASEGTALDPYAERRRLDQAKAEGKNPTGKVPVIGKGGGFLGVF